MNKFIAILVTFAVALFTVNSFADVPASPAPQSWISDTSHVLSADAHSRLDAKLKVINQSSANEIAALIVPTLDGQDISNLANATFKSWGVGKRNLDNGVLVVLAMKEHKTRIETGKGVEGDFPDLKTQDVLQQARPYLRKNDVEGALGFIFDSAASTIANHKAEAAAQAAKGTGATPAPVTNAPPTTSSGGSTNVMCSTGAVGADSGFPVFLILAAIGLVVALVVASNSRRKRREAEETATRERLRKEQAQRLAVARAKREAEAAMVKPTPVVAVPAVTRPVPRPVAPPLPPIAPKAHTRVDHTGVHASASGNGAAAAASGTGTAVAVGAGLATAVALAAEDETRRQTEARARREREEAEASREREESARRRREQEEEDRRRRAREQEDEDRRRRDSESSSSSSSSYDSGSSWGGGSDSGGSGGFGGGGGSSSDW